MRVAERPAAAAIAYVLVNASGPNNLPSRASRRSAAEIHHPAESLDMKYANDLTIPVDLADLCDRKSTALLIWQAIDGDHEIRRRGADCQGGYIRGTIGA